MDDREFLILNSNEFENTEEQHSSSQNLELKYLKASLLQNLIRNSVSTLLTKNVLESRFSSFIKIHWKCLISAIISIISASSTLIFFPRYLELITQDNTKSILSKYEGNGYTASIILTALSTATLLTFGLIVKCFTIILQQCQSTKHSKSHVKFCWISILKIGISSALSILTFCYSWEDQKVLCNFQLPLLGCIFIFASITQALSDWKVWGFRKSCAVIAIAGGIFLSVDFTLLNHVRCRGTHPPPSDRWSWKVHIVWTLAFVVAIWLWTVAIFTIESAIKFPHMKLRKKSELNGVCLTVFRSSNKLSNNNTTEESQNMENGESLENDAYEDIYLQVPLAIVFESLICFYTTTFAIVIFLFWTEFIPGIGKVAEDQNFDLLDILEKGFLDSYENLDVWILVVSILIFSYSFTYLLVTIRSPLLSIGIICTSFPIVSIWWALFQSEASHFLWMPLLSEVICSSLGIPFIIGGVFYLFRLELEDRKIFQ